MEPTINQSHNTTWKKMLTGRHKKVHITEKRTDNMEMKSKWRCPQTLKISETHTMLMTKN